MSHVYIHVSIQASMYSSNYLINLHWEPTVVDSALIARNLNKNQLQSPNFSIVVTVQSKFYLFSKHFASIYYLSVTPLLYRILFYGYQFSVNFNASHTKWPYYLCWMHSLFFSTHMCVPRSCPLQSLTRSFSFGFVSASMRSEGRIRRIREFIPSHLSAGCGLEVAACLRFGQLLIPSATAAFLDAGSALCSKNCFLSCLLLGLIVLMTSQYCQPNDTTSSYVGFH